MKPEKNGMKNGDPGTSTPGSTRLTELTSVIVVRDWRRRTAMNTMKNADMTIPAFMNHFQKRGALLAILSTSLRSLVVLHIRTGNETSTPTFSNWSFKTNAIAQITIKAIA